MVPNTHFVHMEGSTRRPAVEYQVVHYQPGKQGSTHGSNPERRSRQLCDCHSKEVVREPGGPSGVQHQAPDQDEQEPGREHSK